MEEWKKGAAFMHAAGTRVKNRPCELCGEEAVVLCPADQAFLCWDCDASVHGANFLVARHKRSILCEVCGCVTVAVATGDRPIHSKCVCRSCHPTGVLEGGGDAWGTEETEGFGERDGSLLERCTKQARVASSGEQSATSRGTELDGSVSSRLKRTGGRRLVDRCLSPQSVLSCPQSPFVSTAEEVQDSEDAVRLARASERCCSGVDAHEANEEASCSVVRLHENVPVKRRRCKQDSLCRSHEHSEYSRTERVLIRWHCSLGLTSSRVFSLALQIFRRAIRALAPSDFTGDTTRHTLAASLWLAIKLDDEQSITPGATEMGVCTGVTARRLVAAELQLLQLLDWRALQSMLPY